MFEQSLVNKQSLVGDGRIMEAHVPSEARPRGENEHDPNARARKKRKIKVASKQRYRTWTRTSVIIIDLGAQRSLSQSRSIAGQTI